MADNQQELNIVQRLLTSLPESSEANQATQGLISRLIKLENRPEDFAKNPLKALGSSASGALDILGSALGASARAIPEAVVGTAQLAKPILEPLIRGASEQITGGPAQAQTMEQVASQDPLLNAGQQSIQKAEANKQNKNIQEAVDNNVPIEQIQNTLQQQALGRVQAQQQQQQQVQTFDDRLQGLNPLGRAREGFKEGLLQSIGINRFEQALQKEELETKKETLIDKQFNSLLTGAIKPLSIEASKTIGNIDSGLSQIASLEESFANDPTIFQTTNLSSTGQAVDLMVSDLTDILGRLRSGGAINEEEFKSFRRQVPSKGPIKGRVEKASTVILKLKKLKSLFQDIKNRAAPNANNEMSKRIQAARQAGFSKEQIMSSLKQGGSI